MNQVDNRMAMFLVECEDCKHKFRIGTDKDANQITFEKEFNINGKSIFLTYYDCPSCGRRHFVQIDDVFSLIKLKEVKATFVKLSIAKRHGNEISKKQSVKFKKARQHLSDYRIKLMKEYTGKVICDEMGSKFILRFSI